MSQFNLHNLLPFITKTRQTVIGSTEASTLYRIWNNSADSKYFEIPQDVDPILVANLTTKGFLKSKRIANLSSPSQVEITDSGKKVIQNIILHSEKSSFEKQSRLTADAIERAISTINSKFASSKSRTLPRNWLERSLWS